MWDWSVLYERHIASIYLVDIDRQVNIYIILNSCIWYIYSIVNCNHNNRELVYEWDGLDNYLRNVRGFLKAVKIFFPVIRWSGFASADLSKGTK